MSDNHFTAEDISLILSAIEAQVSSNGNTTGEKVYSVVAPKLHQPMLITVFKQELSSSFKKGLFAGFMTKVGRYGGIFRDDAAATAVVNPITIKTSVVARKPSASASVVEEEVKQPAMKVYPPAPIVAPEFDAKKELELQALQDAGISPGLLATNDKPYLTAKPKVVKVEPLKNVLYEPGAVFYMLIKGEQFKVPCAPAYIQTLLTNVFKAVEDVEGEVEFMGKRYFVSEQKMLEDLLLWFLNCSIIRGVIKKENE